MTMPMRALSEAQARECETAKNPECKCRCRGAAHGRARITQDAPREIFEALEPTDPHHLLSKQEEREQAKQRKAERSFHVWHVRPTWVPDGGHDEYGDQTGSYRDRKFAGTYWYGGIERLCNLCLDGGLPEAPKVTA